MPKTWYDHSERRRVPRRQAHLELRELNGQPEDGSYLLDLSELGAKLETPIALTPGAVVELVYFFPGDRRETRRQGRVVWVHPVPSQRSYRIGLEFFD